MAKRGLLFGAFLFPLVVFAAGTPVSVTKGTPCEPPSLAGKPFEVAGPVAALAVPLDGWRVEWPRAEADYVKASAAGIALVQTNAMVRGKEIPALRIELTKGDFKNGMQPVISRAFPVDATRFNVLSFTAKVEVPDGLQPLMRDSPQQPGWYSQQFFSFFDDFGVSVDDGLIPWTSYGVPTTNFRHHDYPETRGKDGFADFVWDMKDEEHTSNKGFMLDRGKAVQLYYDARKIPEGKKVVITVADMKVASGAHIKADEPAMVAAWTNFVANYQPDYSDSSKYLEPPQEGRLGRFSSVRLAKGGQAQAEIVVDLSDAIRIDNFFPTNTWNLELRAARGHEVPVARLAAYDLAHWLKEITGGDFPVLTAPSKERNAKIFLGATYAKDLFPEDLKKLTSGGSTDGFAVRVKGDNVYIFGARPAGTLYGVYRFLENNTDLIWAMAGDPDGTVFTKDPDLTVVWGGDCVKPVFIERGWGGGDDVWKRHNGSNGFSFDQDQGFFRLNGGHFLSPQYYDWCVGLRQYNAMRDGVRDPRWSEYKQLCCLADPKFIGHAMETVPNVKELRYNTLYDCVIGTDDNGGVCQCPLCTKPIKGLDGRTITPETDYPAFYGAWFYSYLNKLDDAIQKVWPGYVTSTYAYFFAADYPPIKVNKTIVPWLCTYIRKAQNEPWTAPMNQSWWRIIKRWMAHNPDLMLYDYYGLGFIIHPKAEVHQFDLKAQRSIGFLRTYTEGFGYAEYMGVADERWCMARLEWDPDADVEQLHRYFNRRTYREAAPWIDKFRGVIRENFYKRGNRTIDFEENCELPIMIRELGLEQELRGYLAKAQAAVKDPRSKILVEKMAADFDYHMTHDDLAWPSKKMGRKAEKAKPAPTAAEAVFAEKGKTILDLAKKGEFALATNLLAAACADRLVPEAVCNRFLSGQAIPALVRADAGFTADEAISLYRSLQRDDVAKALGRSVYMNRNGAGDIRSIAGAFQQRGSFADMAKVYDAWADWDGDQLPVGFRAARLNAKMDALRGEQARAEQNVARCLKDLEARPGSATAVKKAGAALTRLGAVLEAVDRSLGAWRQAVARCAQGGATAQERGDAGLRLLKEDWSRMGGKQRQAAVDRLVFDDFMPNGIRRDAAMMIPGAFADGAKTNWSAAADHVVKAISDGDWSNLGRTCYSRQGRDDYRLNVLCAAAEQMIAAGEKSAAKSMLERGAPVLGYTAAMKPGVAKELFAPEADMKKRLDKLDAVMATCGAARK